MPEYAPPLRDIRFVLEELAGLDSVLQLPAFAHTDRDQIADILGHAGRFATDILSPLYRTGDTEGCRLENGAVSTPAGYADAWSRFCEAGWGTATADPAHGGLGLPRLVGGALAEIWNGANMPFALCAALTESAAMLLARHGSEALQEIWLPKLVSGECTGAMAMTEPQAGSDIGALVCRAVPDGDPYRLFGQKIFVSWGEHDMTGNIVHMALARLPDAPQGSRGISLFLVPKFLAGDGAAAGRRNDMRCLALDRKLGIHASPTCVIEYGAEDGAVGWMVGEPNKGLAAMFTMMNAARVAIGLEGLGLAERALQKARAYAHERRQGSDPRDPGGDVPIVRHGDVRRMLLEMKVRVAAMRALAAEAGRAADFARHHPDPVERSRAEARLGVLTPLVKSWCTDGAVGIASTALQVHGGAGYIEATGAAQILRDARITPIYEGTNGIQALDLVRRKLGGDNGQAVRALVEEIGGIADEALRSDEAALRDMGGALVRARNALSRTTDLLLKDGADSADAAATAYLDMLATVFGGAALMQGAARVFGNQAAAEPGNTTRRTFLALARYYAAAVLPAALVREHQIRDGAPLVQAFPESFI